CDTTRLARQRPQRFLQIAGDVVRRFVDEPLPSRVDQNAERISEDQRLAAIGARIDGLAVAFGVVTGWRGVRLERHADSLAAVIPAAARDRPEIARLRTHVPYGHLGVAFKAA